ncbi:hypothetical protein, conserved [Eimeria necatrix]|uniref:Uncharacterized protein n=1 Tax=Eimeria necatrix TaxID=51315 RepID=U6MP41_9EIME|nr:hypothetical protein, conserved [Eimeria necatrix]CDJ65781.1 hypothetical protein, conserved [Eimeria necatrix]
MIGQCLGSPTAAREPILSKLIFCPPNRPWFFSGLLTLLISLCVLYRTKSLNPNAAPFVPRALPTVSRSSALLSLTRTGRHPDVESTGEASEKAAEAATRTTSKDECTGAARVTASDASTSREPQHHAVESQRNPDENYQHTLLPFMSLDEEQNRKNSSAFSQRAPPRVQTAGILWKYPSTLRENEPRFQHIFIKSRPRSHSAPSNAAAVAERLKASLGNCRYTPVSLLGLRRQALLLASSFEDLQFMLQQQPARCTDELLSSVLCAPPSAISAPKGVKVIAHLHSVFSSAPAPCAPRTSQPDVSSVPAPPPPPPLQEESLQYRRGPWEHLHKYKPPGCPGTRAAQWEGRSSGGPLLPLPRSSPGGPPLLPTPRVPPLTLSSLHPVDRGWLPNSYCISSGPATGVKGAAHPGVPWVMGGFFKEPTPMIHPVMQQGEPQVSLQRLLLHQHELMKHQLLQQRQQGSSLPAPLESKSYPTEQHVERAHREFKFPRKNSGFPRQRRNKQSPLELQKAPDILRRTVHGNQGIEPLSPCLTLSYEAAIHKLLGMVNSLVLARSSCKEVREQQ